MYTIIITIISSSSSSWWCDKKSAVNSGCIKKEKPIFETASGYAKRYRIGCAGSGRRQRSFLIIFRRIGGRTGGQLAEGMPFEDDCGEDDRSKR